MRALFLHALGISVVAASLSGCGTAPASPFRRASLSRQIADDAAAFNEAYGRAVSAQILLNVLRARDRQPRFYLSMSGIQDAPSLRYRENIGASGAPLGEGASPWAFGSVGFERETQSRPSYAVQPLSADMLTRAVFQPTPDNVFIHYWRSGWPRDLLTFLMVEQITRVSPTPDGRSKVEEFVNDAATIRDDCRNGDAGEGCAFVAVAREMVAASQTLARTRQEGDGAPVCNLIEAYGAAAPVRATGPAPGQACPPRVVAGATSYVLTMRSFDDIVYYVGELMRVAFTADPEGRAGVHDAPLHVAAAGGAPGETTPLFRLHVGDVAGQGTRAFAASVSYADQRFHAGPRVGRLCAAGSGAAACAAGGGDRSSSVLSLLSELLALNQSPESIRPPARYIAE